MKYLILIIVFTFMSLEISAQVNDFQYDVSYKNIQYYLINSNDSLVYFDSNFSKKFIKRKCNRMMIDTFLSKLEKSQKKIFPPASNTKQAIVLQNKNNISKRYSTSSKFGKFLLDIPKKILNMAIRDQYRCKK